MAHKQLNWNAIKTRYLNGEKPKNIAKDYGLSAKQVSDKVAKNGWNRKKAEIGEKVEEIVTRNLEQVAAISGVMITDIAEAIKNKELGVTVQDGEGLVNPLYKAAFEKALGKLYPKEMNVTGAVEMEHHVVLDFSDDDTD